MPVSSASQKAATSRRTASREASPTVLPAPAKGRVLIEFPVAALRRADEAARAEGVSRSEFIRTAVEKRLEDLAATTFERELEASYRANAKFNLEILREFEHVDREAWNALP